MYEDQFSSAYDDDGSSWDAPAEDVYSTATPMAPAYSVIDGGFPEEMTILPAYSTPADSVFAEEFPGAPGWTEPADGHFVETFTINSDPGPLAPLFVEALEEGDVFTAAQIFDVMDLNNDIIDTWI